MLIELAVTSLLGRYSIHCKDIILNVIGVIITLHLSQMPHPAKFNKFSLHLDDFGFSLLFFSFLNGLNNNIPERTFLITHQGKSFVTGRLYSRPVGLMPPTELLVMNFILKSLICYDLMISSIRQPDLFKASELMVMSIAVVIASLLGRLWSCPQLIAVGDDGS